MGNVYADDVIVAEDAADKLQIRLNEWQISGKAKV